MTFTLDSAAFEAMIPARLPSKKFKADLRKCGWVYPDGAMGVFLLLRYLVREGLKPVLLRPLNSDVDCYIERMGVYAMLVDDVDIVPEPSDVLDNPWYERATMQGLTHVKNAEDVGSLVDKCRATLSEQIPDLSVASSFSSAFLEIMENMPLHANPEDPKKFEGYANIQTYQNSKRLIMAAGDLGVGIRASLSTNKEYSPKIGSHLDAIDLAVEQRASRFYGTEKKHHGGGLHLAIDQVRGVNAFISVRSGDTLVTWGPNQKKQVRTDLKFFPGTQIRAASAKIA